MNPHGTPVCDGYAYNESLEQGIVGGGHLSRVEHAQALQHVVPTVATLHAGSREGWRHGQKGLQKEVAAVAGGAVTAKFCVCVRAVHYTVIQQLSMTRCFLSLKLPWACFWLFSVLYYPSIHLDAKT